MKRIGRKDPAESGDVMNELPEVPETTACRGMEPLLAEMLLDAEDASASAREHVAGCPGCGQALTELRATMQLLDQWQAPEPNPFFLTRLEARLREEPVPSLPMRWWNSLRLRLMPDTGAGVRPLAAMAMSLLLLLGGGSYLGLTDLDQEKAPSPQAAVVHELQTMDSNAQLLDQLDAMDSSDDGDSAN